MKTQNNNTIDMQKRTEGKWMVRENNDNEFEIISDEYICAIPYQGSIRKAKANAAFIVTACNNHDKLIEALKTFCDLRKADSDNDFNEAYHNAKQLLNEIGKETL